MKRTVILLLSAALLVITAHRLPAPIQEIPESPTPAATPAPKESAKPKPKRTVKPKANENSESSTKRQTPSAKSQPTLQRNPLDGTWVGTLNDIQFTAVISGSATIVRETSTDGTFTWNATYDGRTMRWNWHRPLISGASTAIVIDSNGKTALVTSTSGGAPLLLGAGAHNTSAIFYRISTTQGPLNNDSATFEKNAASAPASVENSYQSSASTVLQSRIVTAKPVPGKPGFVYNPFDSNTKMLLDVRGKPSGTKVKDPAGRLFIVP